MRNFISRRRRTMTTVIAFYDLSASTKKTGRKKFEQIQGLGQRGAEGEEGRENLADFFSPQLSLRAKQTRLQAVKFIFYFFGKWRVAHADCMIKRERERVRGGGQQSLSCKQSGR